jgi:surface-anchored protein
MNKQAILSWMTLGWMPLSAGLVPLGEHVDVRWTYQKTTGQWNCQALTSGPGGTDVFWNFDTVFLPLSDKPYSLTPAGSGARSIQPASAAYAFTGVASGDPLWLAVQGTPGVGEVWPGFENNQPAGTFGAFFSNDTRLSQPQNVAREWIKIAFKGMIYQGTGANPAFSLFTVSGSTPRPWISTSDPATNDFFLYSAGSHIHANWGFGAMGIYRIQLAASAFEGPGQSNPTPESPPFTLTFAVGPFAEWQATHFSGTELETAAISGPEADPDHDGMSNLIEFGFGYDPRIGTSIPIAAGLGLPKMTTLEEGGLYYEVLEYPRRRAGEQIAPLDYSPQFSLDMSPGSWDPAGVVTSSEDFPPTEGALNAVWEKVTSRRELGSAASVRGFARVSLSLPAL